ncbi:hypothetical protein QAD02_006182, partial [Eretmocerus hayati]
YESRWYCRPPPMSSSGGHGFSSIWSSCGVPALDTGTQYIGRSSFGCGSGWARWRSPSPTPPTPPLQQPYQRSQICSLNVFAHTKIVLGEDRVERCLASHVK